MTKRKDADDVALWGPKPRWWSVAYARLWHWWRRFYRALKRQGTWLAQIDGIGAETP